MIAGVVSSRFELATRFLPRVYHASTIPVTPHAGPLPRSAASLHTIDTGNNFELNNAFHSCQRRYMRTA